MLVRKVWADTRALARETISLMVLVALGVGLYVGLYQAYLNLGAVYESIYERTHFAHVSAEFDAGPAGLVDTARTIPGVRVAMGRVVRDGGIIQRGREMERVHGRFIGVPRDRRPPVNDLWILEGRYVGAANEAVLEQQFAHENGYAIGDRLEGIVDQRIREFTVVGFGVSPEYLYPVPDRYAVMVSPGTFGVVFIEDERARDWFGMGRRVNQIHCAVEPGREKEVLEKLRGITRRHGLDFAYVQDDQPSKHLLDVDQEYFATLSIFFPVLFLLAAGLSLYGTMSRIVRLQIMIIGTMRACGFTRREVLLQHLLQGALVPLGGAIPGVFLGYWLAWELNKVYMEIYRLPLGPAALNPEVVLVGLCLAAGTGLAAAWFPARTAASLPPALAMRGEMQTGGAMRAQDAVVRWTRRVSVANRIPLRGVFSRATQTLLAAGGIASGVAVIITTLGLYVAVMDLIDEFVFESRQYEFDLAFTRPQGALLARGAAALPGGRAVALTCSLPVRVHSSWGSADMMLTGLEPGQDLLRVRTMGGERMEVWPGEIWLSQQMADRVGAEPGDPVRVAWTGSSRRSRVRTTMRVAGILDMSMGATAYGEYRDVRRLVDRVWPRSSYGAHLDCDPASVEQLRRRLERSDDIALVSTTEDIREQMEEQLAVTFVFLGVLLTFGMILAGSAIHGVASISLLERTRELAALRSLGFSVTATARLAGMELLLLAVFGLAIGLPMGAWLNEVLMAGVETENMTMRALLPPWTFVLTVVIVLALLACSVWSGARRLRAMDLSQAVKAQE